MERSFTEALAALPAVPLCDLLRSGACTLCVFRVLSVRSRVYVPSVPSAFTVLRHLRPSFEEDGGFASSGHCTLCLGALQNSPKNLEPITKAVQEYEFDDFFLEVTVPPSTLIRERCLWRYIREKHPTSVRFNAEDPNDTIVSLKEAVKWLFAPQLETALNKESSKSSSFKLSLIFKHPDSDSEVRLLSDISGNQSKRRQGSTATTESIAGVQRMLSSISSDVFARHIPSPPGPVNIPCELFASCRREPILIVGNYLKFSRNISQSPWTINEERKGDGSVQEIIGDALFPYFKADSYKFQAAGREDIDVRMLGNGRPFILEILNARRRVTLEELIKIEELINNTNEQVNVKGLKEAGNEARAIMREGEAEKQKEYTAVVWLSRPVTEADFETLSNIRDLEIQQQTPVRVLHRRSPLTRPKIIHWMRCETLDDSKQYFLLHLCTQAGTYIKEFVHGDLGRTYPNVGSLLNCEADILYLDVTNVKMDFVI